MFYYLFYSKVSIDKLLGVLGRVRSVKECHEDFRLETEQVEGQSHESQVRTDVMHRQIGGFFTCNTHSAGKVISG